MAREDEIPPATNVRIFTARSTVYVEADWWRVSCVSGIIGALCCWSLAKTGDLFAHSTCWAKSGAGNAYKVGAMTPALERWCAFYQFLAIWRRLLKSGAAGSTTGIWRRKVSLARVFIRRNWSIKVVRPKFTGSAGNSTPANMACDGDHKEQQCWLYEDMTLMFLNFLGVYSQISFLRFCGRLSTG